MSQSEAATNVETIRDEWLSRLNQLVDNLKTWAEELDWSTRRLEKPMKDMEIGRYQAPSLMMQKEFTRVLLDPYSRTSIGTDGVVELYLMPAVDDAATFYYTDGMWHVQYHAPNRGTEETLRDFASKVLTKETLAEVLDGLVEHVS